jgi:hypothetical protein
VNIRFHPAKYAFQLSSPHGDIALQLLDPSESPLYYPARQQTPVNRSQIANRYAKYRSAAWQRRG